MRAYIRKQKAAVLSLMTALGLLGSLASAAPALAAPLSPAAAPIFAATCTDVNRENAAAQLKETKSQQSGLKCLISNYINPAVAFLAAAAGVAVVISVIIGAIQYSSAGGDPSKVAAARNRIVESIVALLAFLFLYAFLNYLLPGGVNGTTG
jgi:hypothetical protein